MREGSWLWTSFGDLSLLISTATVEAVMLTCYWDYVCLTKVTDVWNKVSWIGQTCCPSLLIAHLHEAISTSLTQVSHTSVGNVWLSWRQTGSGWIWFPNHPPSIRIEPSDDWGTKFNWQICRRSLASHTRVCWGREVRPVMPLSIITSNLYNVQNPSAFGNMQRSVSGGMLQINDQ